MQLTAKEKSQIKENITAEEICIQKYQAYANQAQDQEVADLFNNLADKERQHAQTLNDLLNGKQQNQQQQSQQLNLNTAQQQKNEMEVANAAMEAKNAQNSDSLSDRQLLQDALMTEKYVSNSYDNSVLESANQEVMQALEHIQQEEHQHKQQLFEMMNQKGWKTVNPANN
ncbi:spore coat protein [Fuchsiella alkaliacetigena]|uniref:spore coat protein n=1 Tax=Fuchsiella alkaliacetigena TaxID=957042 RepID=UPI00200B74C0|nr:spore coat protein [Fuchsiella alkaliacetigena]MCK8825313.1 spore coat protein [Fuchsiella alkaliacetigena]